MALIGQSDCVIIKCLPDLFIASKVQINLGLQAVLYRIASKVQIKKSFSPISACISCVTKCHWSLYYYKIVRQY